MLVGRWEKRRRSAGYGPSVHDYLPVAFACCQSSIGADGGAASFFAFEACDQSPRNSKRKVRTGIGRRVGIGRERTARAWEHSVAS